MSFATGLMQVLSILLLDLHQDALLPDIFPDDAGQPGFRDLRVADFRAFMPETRHQTLEDVSDPDTTCASAKWA
eukprot:s641_g15.t1